MTVILIGLVMLLVNPDPVPGVFRSRDHARTLECERLDAQDAARRYPGQVEPDRPRGEFLQRSALVCTQRLMRPGLRDDRDEAILADLGPLVTDLTTGAGDIFPELSTRTWLVEAYYPSTQVAAKLAFAAKNELVARGLRVSDRAPTLNAADVDVVTRMAPQQAYPAACRRYRENGSLGAGDVLLAVVSRDPRETTLHAGLCTDGEWAWLR